MRDLPVLVGQQGVVASTQSTLVTGSVDERQVGEL